MKTIANQTNILFLRFENCPALNTTHEQTGIFDSSVMRACGLVLFLRHNQDWLGFWLAPQRCWEYSFDLRYSSRPNAKRALIRWHCHALVARIALTSLDHFPARADKPQHNHQFEGEERKWQPSDQIF